MTDLALLDEVLERPGGLLSGCVLIGPVDLVQADVVSTQVPKARFDTLPQPRAARISEEPVSLHPEAALRGNEHVLPPNPRPKSVTEEAFGGPEAVALRSVEERDPELERPADRCRCLVRVEPTPIPAERPGPEGDP